MPVVPRLWQDLPEAERILMHNGWIKLHRSMADSWIMQDPPSMAVWMYLLLNATHAPRKVMIDGKFVMLQPGQLTAGRRQIAETLSISENQTRRAIILLKTNQQIHQLTYARCSLYTVLNWSKYQDDHQVNHQLTTSKPPADHQLTTTKQECKNERMEEKKETGTPPARFKKPAHEELKLQCAKIGLPESEAVRFMDYYESNGWRVGRNPMKSWTHALGGWKLRWEESRDKTASATKTHWMDTEIEAIKRSVQQNQP